MRPTIAIYDHRLAHARPHLEAFAAGLRRHGQPWQAVPLTAAPVRSDLAVFWGHRRKDVIAAQRAGGGRYLVLERGYVGGRFRWTSAGYDGLNGRADFCNSGASDERFKRHLAPLLAPWRPPGEGEYVLLVGQCRGDESVRHLDMSSVLARAAADLRSGTHLPTRFRPHPQDPTFPAPPGTTLMRGTLEQALHGAHVVVTINSNTGVDAAFAGVPVIALDRGSMAWPIAGHDVRQAGDPARPSRDRWAAELAWCQWTDEELAGGEAWSHLQQGLPAAIAGGQALERGA